MSKPDDKWQAHARLAPENPWDFVLICRTLDEHDPLAGAKLFPELAMYRILVRMWMEHNVFFLEKSRQHLFTWLMAILLLWDAMHKTGRRNIIGSINQLKANKVTKRIKILYRHLERDHYPYLAEARKISGRVGIGHQVEFLPPIDSLIESVPQGEDAVVSETISNFVDDEIHFQPDAEARFEKSIPAILGGGKYVGGGSPNGRATFGYRKKYAIDPYTGRSKGEHKLDSRSLKSVLEVPTHRPDGFEMTTEEQRFWIENRLVTMPDEEFNSIPLPELIASCPGLHYWITCEDTVVFGMHYRANPHHDPITEEGQDWYDERRPHFTKGQWDRQMEISYDTFEGRPVVDIFADNKESFVRSCEYDPRLTLDLTWDPGTVGACCLISQKHKISGFSAYQTRFIGEVFLTDTITPELVVEVKDYIGKHFPAALSQMGNMRSVCDTAANQPKETASDKNFKRSVDVIKEGGFRYISSKKVGVPSGIERVQSVFAKVYPVGDPPTAVVVDPRCRMLIDALTSGWRFPMPKDDRAAMKVSKGYPEKDGWFEHVGDCVRYRLVYDFPSGKDVLEARPDAGRKYVKVFDRYTGRLKGYRPVRQKGSTHVRHSARVA